MFLRHLPGAALRRLEMAQPFMLLGAQRAQHLRRQLALLRQHLQLLEGCRYPLAPRRALVGALGPLLAPARVRQAKRTHDHGQKQPLPDQGHQDHGEGQEKDQVAPGEGLAVLRLQRNRQRGGQRDNAAYAGKSQRKRPLPGWRRVVAANSRNPPARQVGCRKNPHQTREDHHGTDDRR